MPYFGSTIFESADKSVLNKGFKKKGSINSKVILLRDNNLNKYISSKKYHYRLDGNTEDLSKDISTWKAQNRKGAFIIDLDKDQLAGFVCVRSNGTLSPIYVFPEYRGYGISEQLMDIAINKFGANTLGVYTDNQVAINLYKKYGFEITKTDSEVGGKFHIMHRENR